MLSYQQLILIVVATCLFSLWIERKLAWVSHISGICLTILAAIVLSGLGIIPHQHEIYDFFMGPAVPVAIALLVFGLQFRNLVALPKSLLLIFAFGTLSSILGGVIVALFSAKKLGENAPKLAAQLTASYIGGNENAVALAKILEVPTELFVAVFSIDNVVTSLWMLTTLTFARSEFREIEVEGPSERTYDNCQVTLVGILASLALGILVVELSYFLNTLFGGIHPLLYLTVVAFLASRFPVIQELVKPAYLIGTVIFAPFFFSSGAISDLSAIARLPIEVLMMPFLVVGIHGIFIFSFGKLLKIPSSETSLASQALIGGAGTAVALAQAKSWKSGISFGLILGLAGYAIANFCGIFVYYLSSTLIRTWENWI